MRLTQVFTILESDQTSGTLVKMGRAYDAGAKRILSDVANVKLMNFEATNQVFVSKETKTQRDKLSVLYRVLLEKLENDKELRELFCEYDNEVCSWASLSSTDTFIQGFLEGYNFSQASNERDEF